MNFFQIYVNIKYYVNTILLYIQYYCSSFGAFILIFRTCDGKQKLALVKFEKYFSSQRIVCIVVLSAEHLSPSFSETN